jgi:sulfur carrier protein ThiS
MRVGLVDLDRTGFPNLALMKLSAWHKARGDDVQLLRGPVHCDQLYGSAVFSWNRPKALALRDLGATVGGSGVDLVNTLPDEVERMRPDYDLYGIDYGLGYLMRGCIWRCTFCLVPQKEGKARAVATIDDLLHPASARPRPFVVLLDNEFFWREQWAIAQLEAFTARGIDWCPSQGLDVRVVTPALAAALAASPFWNVQRSRRQVTFAFDDLATARLYRRGVERVLAAGVKPWQLQSFVLVGHNSTIAEDLERLAIIRSYGIDPFVMVYRDVHTGQMARDPQLRNLARWVNRRLYKTCTFPEYWPEAARAQQRLLPLMKAG